MPTLSLKAIPAHNSSQRDIKHPYCKERKGKKRKKEKKGEEEEDKMEESIINTSFYEEGGCLVHKWNNNEFHDSLKQ
jgi:hypothetical protein